MNSHEHCVNIASTPVAVRAWCQLLGLGEAFQVRFTSECSSRLRLGSGSAHLRSRCAVPRSWQTSMPAWTPDTSRHEVPVRCQCQPATVLYLKAGDGHAGSWRGAGCARAKPCFTRSEPSVPGMSSSLSHVRAAAPSNWAARIEPCSRFRRLAQAISSCVAGRIVPFHEFMVCPVEYLCKARRTCNIQHSCPDVLWEHDNLVLC
ncbi:hypothetical protein OH76DRAFT_551900 [Lentinus brumalis]|uniref:Uncharacterized protein n=1 Tax=Lentinus brumalis TaxID=2498619 RepID=A0A371CHJ4_9APHY|nr:hypothetical protein OH76DRAFT_551900 [Polyporus brumalis]